MTTRSTFTDPDSLSRQRKLLKAFEMQADLWHEIADTCRAAGDLRGAAAHESLAKISLESANRIQLRLWAAQTPVSGGILPTGGLSDLMARGPAGDTAWLPSNTVAPPEDYQTYATPIIADDVLRVVHWLRWDLPEYWWTATHERLEAVARWLLALRQACWSGRWRV